MKERRRSKRRELLLFLPVYDRESGEVLGHLADITAEGLMLFSQQCVELGKKFNLEIRIDDLRNALVYKQSDNNTEEDIQFVARSRWIAINPDLYRTGFMFVDMPNAARESVEQIIQNLDTLV